MLFRPKLLAALTLVALSVPLVMGLVAYAVGAAPVGQVSNVLFVPPPGSERENIGKGESSGDPVIDRVLKALADSHSVHVAVVMQTASYGPQLFGDPTTDVLAERFDGDFGDVGSWKGTFYAPGESIGTTMARTPEGVFAVKTLDDGGLAWVTATAPQTLLLRTVYGGVDPIADLAHVLTQVQRVEYKGTGKINGQSAIAVRLYLDTDGQAPSLIGDTKPLSYVANQVDLILDPEGRPLQVIGSYTYWVPTGKVSARQTLYYSAWNTPIEFPSFKVAEPTPASP